MKRVDLYYFEAGGGHRAAAQALQQVIEEQKRPWDVELVNLQQLLIELDLARKLFNVHMEDVYNFLLKKGWTLGMAHLKVLLTAFIRSRHAQTVRELANYLGQRRPDLAVSVVPHFQRAIHEAIQVATPDTQFITILTDFADFPPHFWIEEGQEQWLICGTDRAVEQARSMGHKSGRIFRVSGMIVHPRFYQPMDIDRAGERERLGLDPELKTGLVLFGGEGSGSMVKIARRLDAADLPVQLIMICGRNRRLRDTLQEGEWRIRMFVEGFTREVPYYMKLSDFFIGKPGPGSISEAVTMHLPLITERNAWTMPQERYNTEWVVEKDVGIVVRSFDEIVPAVRHLLEPHNYEHFHNAAAAHENRAVFEIPDILERILSHAK